MGSSPGSRRHEPARTVGCWHARAEYPQSSPMALAGNAPTYHKLRRRHRGMCGRSLRIGSRISMRRAVAGVVRGARQRSVCGPASTRAYPPSIWRELSQRKSRICPGQVRRAGCPLTSLLVRGAGCRLCGQFDVQFQPASQIPDPLGYGGEAVLPNGRSWWVASARNRPASGPPPHRACPPAGRRARSAMRSTHRRLATPACTSPADC
jgi:hypothetical protein